MTSTIATLATEVENRLNLTHDGAEPTVAMLSDFLRLAFKDIIGVLPLVQHTTLTVGNAYSAALTHDRLWFVSASGIPLFPWEFQTSGANVVVQSTAAERGDTIQVWYSLAPSITTGSEATVDTDCIFGNDWLEELAVIKAAMEAAMRLSGVSPSNSGPDYGVLFRTLGEQYDRIFAAHRAEWDRWERTKNMELQARQMNGPEPRRYSRHVGFINNSSKGVWVTGAGDEGIPD
jgi:hypothetical protein